MYGGIEDARILRTCAHIFLLEMHQNHTLAFASSSAAAKRFHSGSLLVSSAPMIVMCPEFRVSSSLNPEPLKKFSICSIFLPPPSPSSLLPHLPPSHLPLHHYHHQRHKRIRIRIRREITITHCENCCKTN
jgi:hypothetical protein